MRTDFRRISEIDHVPIIRKDTEGFLESFIKKNKIKKILEFGTAIGYSALFFSKLKKNIEVFSVEKDKYAFEIAKHNIQVSQDDEKDFPRINLIHGDATKISSQIRKLTSADFDMVFIDGGKSHYKEQFEEAVCLCKKGGYILCDDIWQRGLTRMSIDDVPRKHRTSMKNMQEFLEYIKNSSKLSTEIYDIGDGLSVSKIKLFKNKNTN